MSKSSAKNQDFKDVIYVPINGSVIKDIPVNENTNNFMKLVSAIFYGFSSFLIVVINKIVLTNFK